MSLIGRTPGSGTTNGRTTIHGNLRAQFGLGISLGLMIGLLPKDSLLPWAFGLLTLIAPVNLGAALVAMVVGLCLNLALEPVAHSVGQIVLSNATVVGWMTHLNELPVFAWTRLNNSVVMGLTVIGILAFIPAYLTAHALFRDPRFSGASSSDQYIGTADDYPVVHAPTLQES